MAASRGEPKSAGAEFTPNRNNNPNDIRKPTLPDYMRRQDSNSITTNTASNDQNQFQRSNSTHTGSSTIKDQSATGVNSPEDGMLEKVIQFGKDSYIIKAHITCKNQELFALECERPISGYEGICPACHGQHVKLAKSRGYYTSAHSVKEALAQQKLAKERAKGPKEINELPIIKDNLPPLDHPILGNDKGIQGDSNSCYMDSTIFCMFAYSDVFDPLLHVKVHKKQPIKDLQRLLRENIVNVLRSESGSVERDALFHLRALLSEATGDQSFREMEKDPSEFLRALEELFHYAPLQTIPPDQPPKQDGSKITTNIMWEMFDANPQNLPSTKIASIFRNSLSEIPAKLATIPPFLILVAPRHTRSQRSYRYIIPDRQITLDNKIVQLVCLKCKQTNHDSEQSREFYFCNECYLKESSPSSTSPTDTTVVCFCSSCLSELHGKLPEKIRCEHNIKPMKTISYKLNLFAVLCIETSHYVAFVKCHKPDHQHEWIFFDSMSDRILNEKNVSCVTSVPNFDRWIDDAEKNEDFFFEELDRRRKQGRPTSHTFNEDGMRQLRLFRDGAFFFYENSAVNYQ